MRHAYLEVALKQPAIRLIHAVNAPLIISFLHEMSISRNQRSIGHDALLTALDDAIYTINAEEGEVRYPSDSAIYLADWAHESTGYLAKRLPEGANEAEYDLTTAAEKAIVWVESQERLRPSCITNALRHLAAKSIS